MKRPTAKETKDAKLMCQNRYLLSEKLSFRIFRVFRGFLSDLQSVLCQTIVLILTIFSQASANQPEDTPTAWATGAAFQQRLKLPIGTSWKTVPIRDGLKRLGKTQGIAVWLDRRVDPGARVTHVVNNIPFLQAVEEIAAKTDLGVCVVGSVVYVGPRNATNRLATIAKQKRDEISKIDLAARNRWRKSARFQWEILARPRILLAELVQEIGLQPASDVSGVQQLPHDLWPAGDYPAMSATDRISLLLAGFGLTYEIQNGGAGIALIPMPDTVAITESITPPSRVLDLQPLRTKFPDVQFAQNGRNLTLTGTIEAIQSVKEHFFGGPNAASMQGAQTRLTLNVQQAPAGAIIKTIMDREKLNVDASQEVMERLKQKIDINVDQVPLTELLDKVVKPIGLKYDLSGKNLTLTLDQ